MSNHCGDEDALSEALLHRVGELFRELEAAGNARLHPVELDIVEALKVRPRSAWCQGQLRLLDAIVRKAKGEPWRPLLEKTRSR